MAAVRLHYIGDEGTSGQWNVNGRTYFFNYGGDKAWQDVEENDAAELLKVAPVEQWVYNPDGTPKGDPIRGKLVPVASNEAGEQ